jgi:hypothetical protein
MVIVDVVQMILHAVTDPLKDGLNYGNMGYFKLPALQAAFVKSWLIN